MNGAVVPSQAEDTSTAWKDVYCGERLWCCLVVLVKVL